MRVTGSIAEGEITGITAINGAELKTDEGATSKVFKVTDNGTFRFKITGSNGRSTRVSCDITNIVPFTIEDDILTAVGKFKSSGKKKIQVTGSENTEIYSLNVIRYEGDMVLDGSTTYEGSTLVSNVYEFGNSSKDVGTASSNAQNTVVLKVEGNLTINSGVTLTSVKNSAGYGGPKGMIVYCTGTLTNNGTMSMTARGAKAPGQNIYLSKLANNSFVYIGASGGAGAPASSGIGSNVGSNRS